MAKCLNGVQGIERTRTVNNGAHAHTRAHECAHECAHDCDHLHCSNARARGVHVVNHGYKQAHQLAMNETNRVSLPGDVDYAGVCQC